MELDPRGLLRFSLYTSVTGGLINEIKVLSMIISAVIATSKYTLIKLARYSSGQRYSHACTFPYSNAAGHLLLKLQESR